MGYYECEELACSSCYYNDAVHWALLGYTVWYIDAIYCERQLLWRP